MTRSVAEDWLNKENEPADSLTQREREVLQLTAEGLVMKEVAAKLGVSVKTVETHRRTVMTKLNLFSVAELTKFAARGMVQKTWAFEEIVRAVETVLDGNQFISPQIAKLFQ